MLRVSIKSAKITSNPQAGTRELFDASTNFETLWKSWEKVRRNKGSAGGDGLTISQVERDAPTRISRLSHAMRNGNYRPGAYRKVRISKKSGGTRTLSIPSVMDRIAQGAVALILTPLLETEFEPSSFGYRKGKGVAKAIAMVASLRRKGFTHVVDADIKSYFNNVRHDRLLDLLDEYGGDEKLSDLIALWLEHYSRDDCGLPQGSPLSPLLANLYLDALDEALHNKNIRIVRFADDFVVLCKSEALAANALSQTSELLAEFGLDLHTGKTRLTSFDKGFRFLGHVLARSLVFKETALDDTPDEDTLAALVGRTNLNEVGVPAPPKSEEEDENVEYSAPGRWSPRRRVMYVIEKDRTLAANGTHFRVFEDDTLLLDLPAARVDRIDISRNNDVTMEALDLAAASDTEIVRIDGHGGTLGRWIGPDNGAARLHLAQAANILDAERRSSLARSIVASKVFNGRALLKLRDRKEKDEKLVPYFTRSKRIIKYMERGNFDVQKSMGYEGEAASLYWPMLAHSMNHEWAFTGLRRRRHGFDPFNASHDLICSLLLRDCASALNKSGLHPGYGILHQTMNGEDALSYDLAEEFRAPIAEALTVSMFTRRHLRPEHFVKGNTGTRLASGTYAKLIRAYEQKLSRPIKDPISQQEVLWRALMDRQAHRLADALREGTDYQPYRMPY